jgi:hypothetical protein
MLWRMLWRAQALLLAVMVGCAGTPRAVRVDTEQGKAVIHIPRTAEVQPVVVEEEEFHQAMRQLAREARLTGTPRQTAERMFQLDPLSGNYLYLPRDRKLVPAGPGESWDGKLMEEVKVATTFEQIRDAGERFGKLLGRESARAFAMLLLAAIGQTAQGFAAKVPTLPGSAQVAMQAEGGTGIWLPALGAVEEIALAEESVTVTLPANAVAMAARGSGGKGPCVDTHHIATVCNDKDAKRGGPWTPRFREIFAKAGMTLEDPANKLPLPGHYGPHPERYHQIILEELADATETCQSVVECREALTGQLRKLAKQIATPGTELNQLVTRQQPR